MVSTGAPASPVSPGLIYGAPLSFLRTLVFLGALSYDTRSLPGVSSALPRCALRSQSWVSFLNPCVHCLRHFRFRPHADPPLYHPLGCEDGEAFCCLGIPTCRLTKCHQSRRLTVLRSLLSVSQALLWAPRAPRSRRGGPRAGPRASSPFSTLGHHGGLCVQDVLADGLWRSRLRIHPFPLHVTSTPKNSAARAYLRCSPPALPLPWPRSRSIGGPTCALPASPSAERCWPSGISASAPPAVLRASLWRSFSQDLLRGAVVPRPSQVLSAGVQLLRVGTVSLRAPGT